MQMVRFQNPMFKNRMKNDHYVYDCGHISMDSARVTFKDWPMGTFIQGLYCTFFQYVFLGRIRTFDDSMIYGQNCTFDVSTSLSKVAISSSMNFDVRTRVRNENPQWKSGSPY